MVNENMEEYLDIPLDIAMLGRRDVNLENVFNFIDTLNFILGHPVDIVECPWRADLLSRIGGSLALNNLWEKLFRLQCESSLSKKSKAECISEASTSQSCKKPRLSSLEWSCTSPPIASSARKQQSDHLGASKQQSVQESTNSISNEDSNDMKREINPHLADTEQGPSGLTN